MLLQVGRAVPTTPWELVLTSSRETKFVLAILVVFSLVSWYLIFLKWWQFRKMRRQADRFMAEIERATRLERSEEHTSELQSRLHLVCRLLLEKKSHEEAVTLHRSSSPRPG